MDDRCVEVDATTWHTRRMVRERYDWSAQSSRLDARETRLAALDHLRRTVPAGDSRRRVRQPGLSLLEEVDAVEHAVDAFNEERHVRSGFVIGRLRELPVSAVREAIVNGVVHREWAGPASTTVEHVGRSLTVTSPGGFIGGVNAANIITHPSQPRNRALAELFAALRIAEREGIGVDRMVRDMIAIGYHPPSIEEIPGPHVRTALFAESLDEAWIRFVGRVEADEARGSLTVLLLLREVVASSWFDVTTAAPLLQLNAAETAEAIHVFARVTVGGAPLVEPVAGIPTAQAPAWRLARTATSLLASDDAAVGQARALPDRATVAMSWATARERVSSTELASILGVSQPATNRLLQSLRDDGLLSPSRAAQTGRGFFYRPVGDGPVAGR